jgi:putative membrane protein
MIRLLGMAVLIVFGVLGASTAFSNAGYVTFHYLFGVVQIRLILLLVAVFAVAVLISVLVFGVRVLALRGELRRVRRQLRDAETELKNLRNLPLRDA